MLQIEEMLALAEADCAPVWAKIARVERACFQRVLACLQEERVGVRHFAPSTGYGYSDIGRDALSAIFAELMGRETGLSKGMGGSMHFFDVNKGLMGGNGIVGGGLTLSIGTAYASKYRGDDRVTVCFFSDGASNEGWFHEAINMAALWKLPVLFCCENNLFAATTPSFKTLPDPDIYKRAHGYGIPGICVDGNELDDCIEKTKQAVKHARQGHGPTLLEYKTYRVEGHCMVLNDLPVHRPKDEVKRWAAKDPIKLYSKKLIREGKITQADLKTIGQEVEREIAEAIEFAKNSPKPDTQAFLKKAEERYAI